MQTTRRGLAALTLAFSPPASAAAAGGVEETEAVLRRYVGFGLKASGGPGDEACGDWLDERLRQLGFSTERQRFKTPFFEAERTELVVEGFTIPLRAQEPVRLTPPDFIVSPLALLLPWGGGVLRDRIAVAPLPYRRWSTTRAPEIQAAVNQAKSQGAAGLVFVTEGPSGETLALNAGADDAWPAPMAVVGPSVSKGLVQAASSGLEARLTLAGKAGHRSAFNLIGRLNRGRGRTVIISTPRSGWTACAGERGSGVAAWLSLAAWAAATPRYDMLFLCTSGHEYENLGSQVFLGSSEAPAPGTTALWAHLGANIAARDWHEGYGPLRPLPTADPQRILIATSGLAGRVAGAVSGLPGLQKVYDARDGAAGELAEILAHGYPDAFGVFGAHRLHHALGDDLKCVDARLTTAAAAGLRAAVAAALP